MWILFPYPSFLRTSKHIGTRVRESKLNKRLYSKRSEGKRKIDFPPRAWRRRERSEGSEVPSRRVEAGFSLRKKQRRRERSREPRPRNSTRDSQRSGIMLIYRSNFDNARAAGLADARTLRVKAAKSISAQRKRERESHGYNKHWLNRDYDFIVCEIVMWITVKTNETKRREMISRDTRKSSIPTYYARADWKGLETPIRSDASFLFSVMWYPEFC